MSATYTALNTIGNYPNQKDICICNFVRYVCVQIHPPPSICDLETTPRFYRNVLYLIQQDFD